MAITFSPAIKKDRQKSDKTWNVKIRVTSQRQVRYIQTDYYVMKHQLSRKGMDIIDVDILTACEKIIERYKKYVLDTPETSVMPVGELAEFLQKTYKAELLTKNGILLSSVADRYIKDLINQDRDKYADSIAFTSRAIDILRPHTSMSDITLDWLNSIQVEMTKMGLKQNSINVHLRNIRTLFNYAINIYNDDEKGVVVIKHYPFRKFKFKQAPAPAKRNVSADIIKSIASFPDTEYPRINMARDVFVLSFCLLGMNTADLYSCTDYINGRIIYTRKKTRRKGDKARISVPVPDICLPILDRYTGKDDSHVFDFSHRYSSPDNFSKNVNTGLKYISQSLGLDVNVTTYYARHSFATIARNDCGVSKDDIAVCLTHSSAHDITDRYIAEDWSIIDRTQEKVLSKVFGE